MAGGGKGSEEKRRDEERRGGEECRSGHLVFEKGRINAARTGGAGSRRRVLVAREGPL